MISYMFFGEGGLGGLDQSSRPSSLIKNSGHEKSEASATSTEGLGLGARRTWIRSLVSRSEIKGLEVCEGFDGLPIF